MKRNDLRKIFTDANIEVSEEVVSKIINNFHSDLDQLLEGKEQELADKYKDYVSADDAKKIQDDLAAANQKYTDYVAQVETRDRTNAIESAIKNAKGRNLKAIQSLLDDSKIKFKEGKLEGLDEQITALKESDSYLFDSNNANYSGGKPIDSPNNGNTSGLTLEALRNL